MADIKQAAKWMQEGKQVRRRDWVPCSVYGVVNGAVRWIWNGKVLRARQQRFLPEELLAKDWEIAP